MKRLADQLRSAVREMAYKTSVDQLKKRGLNQVNVVSLDRIVVLIEEAVHRSLRQHLLGAERDRVVDATKEEFLRLMRSNEQLESEASELRRTQVRAQEEIDHLRRELADSSQQLDAKLAQAAFSTQAQVVGENEALAARFSELFASLSEGGDIDPQALRDGAFAILLQFADAERREALMAKEAARDRDVELLQRRIAKLSTTLEESEQRMAKLAALKNVDPGISSIYREVQGLDPAAELFQKKSALMADIFKANLALQKGPKT